MSKMMIVAATSEKMLELMDKITIEEGVISFLASNKATAKGYPCMFSVEGKTTTASVKFEAKIKGLDEKGEVVPVEKLSVYLPARFAGSVRAVAEQTDIVYMQFEEKQVTLLSQKPAIQIPVSFVEEPTKVKNPKTDAFSMSIPLEKISDEYEYNRATGEEIPTLYLEEKIVDMTNILMVLATSFTTNGMVGEFEPTEYSRIKSIISKNVRKIYADCGLRDKDAASLYETVPASGGSFGSGRRKKRLPQMHDFYRAILLDARENTDSFKENAFSLLLDIFEDRVREMYYCPHCMKEFTREELSTLKRTEGGVHICNNHEEGKIYYLREIHGSQAYLDCQSTLSIDMSLPFHNFDLSQITDETERINMIMVVQSYIEENFIKKNSTNQNKAKKLIVSTDEAHRILKFEGARMFENALYRVARKRHTAPWLILQSVKDFAKYQDTEEILKSTETFMLFRHNYLDGQYIKDTTNLNQSQVDTVLNLGGTSEAKKYGELCLVDIPTKRAVFIQADYLKDSEFDVVETDVEKIAEHARMKQGA